MSGTYNGWTNWETWLTKLWLDNDFDLASADLPCRINAETEADGTLAQAIKECVEEGYSIPDTGFIADLIRGSLSEVNWHEIAKSLAADADDEED